MEELISLYFAEGLCVYCSILDLLAVTIMLYFASVSAALVLRFPCFFRFLEPGQKFKMKRR